MHPVSVTEKKATARSSPEQPDGQGHLLCSPDVQSSLYWMPTREAVLNCASLRWGTLDLKQLWNSSPICLASFLLFQGNILLGWKKKKRTNLESYWRDLMWNLSVFYLIGWFGVTVEKSKLSPWDNCPHWTPCPQNFTLTSMFEGISKATNTTVNRVQGSTRRCSAGAVLQRSVAFTSSCVESQAPRWY